MARTIAKSFEVLDSSLSDIKSALSDALVEVSGDLKVSEVASYIKKIDVVRPPVYLCTGSQFKTVINTIYMWPTSIIFTKDNPPSGVTTYNLGVENETITTAPNKDTIVAWKDRTNAAKIYVSGKGSEIIANQDCSEMFRSCTELTSLDLSNFNTQNVTTVNGMFKISGKLKTIYASDWTSNSKITSSTDVFTNCTSLTGYSSSKVTGAYCKPIASGGYFTTK